MINLVYCEKCNELVEYNIMDRFKLENEGLNVEFIGSRSYCKVCNYEVLAEDVDLNNFRLANEVYSKSKDTNFNK